MDCKECSQICCRNFDIIITDEEYQSLKKILPSLKTVDFDLIHYIISPCPFFNQEKNICNKYDQRPLSCQTYPLQASEDYRFPNKVLIYTDLNCPECNNISKIEKQALLKTLVKTQNLFNNAIDQMSLRDKNKANLHGKKLKSRYAHIIPTQKETEIEIMDLNDILRMK
jgi:Fe-S-cluster containining protein